jgi:hypothetical protein
VTLEVGSPHILSKDDGLVVARIGPTCAVVWRSAVTWERFSAQRRGLDLVVRANSVGGVGFVCVIEATSPVPSLELQWASANMIAIHRPRLGYVACVVEGDDLRASIVRGVLKGMRALVTGRFSYDFFGTVGEAAARLSEALSIGPAEDYADAVEKARAELPLATERVS